MNELVLLVRKGLRSLWRFRWIGICAAWVIATSWWIVVAIQPDVFEAKARVYVDTSSDLRQLLRDQIVDISVQDQLAFVRQAMLGAPQLRQLARELELVSESQSDSELDRAAESLGDKIQISGGLYSGPGESENLYTISYRDRSRLHAIEVVQSLLDVFVETSVEAKQSSSEEASRFLRQQIKQYEERMRNAERKLAEFKRVNVDRLPNLQGGYFERLQTAINQLNESERQLNLARSRAEELESRISGTSPHTNLQDEMVPGSIEARISDWQMQLDDLRLQYTEQHPDVVAIRQILEDLRRQQREDGSAGVDSERDRDNPVRQALVIARNEASTDVAALAAEVSQRRDEVARLRELMDEMPIVEAELAQLTRDYDVINAHYQSLLDSLERDQLSREVFQSEKIDFRIIDPPGASLDPVAPPRIPLLIVGFLGAIATGIAGAVGLGYVFPVFDSPAEISERFDSVHVLGTVSTISSADHDGSLWKQASFAIIGSGTLIVFCAFILVYESVGPGLRQLM